MMRAVAASQQWMVVLLVIVAWATPLSSAGPVEGKVLPLRQPDGQTIQVRIWGDEFYTVVESLDGYTLVRDPATQVICYARLSPDGNTLLSTGARVGTVSPALLGVTPHIRINQSAVTAQVRAAREDFERRRLEALPAGMDNEPEGPTLGDVMGITLLIDFSDDVGTIAPATVEQYCNKIGYAGSGNKGSVRDYYFDVSNGKLNYTNFVPTAYYRAAHPKTYYIDPNISFGQRARELILEALQALDDGGFDFSLYDADKDGIVDALNCFYAGFSNSAWAQGLWPHAWSVHFCADGVCTYRYQMTDMQNALTLATFCHENGHMLMGWPDLYDYDYDSSGVGKFCLMCTYTSDTNPQQPCAYMKYRAGWADLRLLTTPQMGLLAPVAGNVIYKYEHPTAANEYYLIENRQRLGRDAGLPDAGLAIWHVDTTGSNNNQQMTPESHYLVTLVQADGRWDLERYVNDGDATDLWAGPGYIQCAPHTNPNTHWWDGSSSLLSVHHISASGPQMTFTFITSDVDCNNNGLPDNVDLLAGTSKDCNLNNLPDECDIAAGTESDCNNNSVPDSCDVAGGFSADCNANGVPDECDLNPSELVVTDAYGYGGFSVYNLLTGTRRYTMTTGYLPSGVAYGPNGNLFLWQQESGPLWEYDGKTGALIGPRVAMQAGGVVQGRGITFMPNGDILVAGGTANRVPRFAWADGRYLGDFVTTGSGGLTAPWGLTFGPNGNLFVGSSATNEVLEYDGQTGAYVRTFVVAGAGGIDRPYDLKFGPDGHLYVSSRTDGYVYRYDGQTGAFLGLFTQTPVPPARGLAFGPNGDLFVASASGPAGGAAYQYDGRTGALVHTYPNGAAMFLAFRPWEGVISPDCNRNGAPDECDIAAGVVSDLNGNGVPDQCEALGDLNCDGYVDFGDINPFVLAFMEPATYAATYPDCPLFKRDINGDGVFNDQDINGFVFLLARF
ncbi:MAG: M6 family metalloprotease domain-containing protein [Planctomycetota bacterium]